MLRKNPIKFLNSIHSFPKPLCYIPRIHFSENDDKNNKNEDKKPKPSKFSISQFINKLNTFLETRESSIMKWVASIDYKNAHISHRKMVLLVASLFFVGYNLKKFLFYAQDISYTVKKMVFPIKLNDFYEGFIQKLYFS